MVKLATTLLPLIPMVAAWPTVMEMDMHLKRAASGGRLNTGTAHPNPSFDAAAQYVDVTPGSGHEFQSPGPNDRRGQCPGLNAAANHGFLPRSGLPSITETATGLEKAYNMNPVLGAALAAVAVLISGDIPSLRWSIGGGFPSTLPLVLSNPKGLYGSHNKYEGDASIVRGDAHLNNGLVDVFQNSRWKNLIDIAGDDGLTLAKTTILSQINTNYSISNNPYYFSGPFSGIVAPAAHNFVINFMSNHSAENPGGFLTKDVVKSFFAVTGDDNNFVHHPGQERIPENWYRRPGGLDQYNLADVFIDVLAGNVEQPGTFRIGGNTGTVNSFTGVNLGDLTGGVLDAATLLEGNNLACFAFQAAMAGGIDELDGLLSLLGGLLDPVLDPIKAAVAGLACPQLPEFHSQLFTLFPGYKGT